MPTFTPQQLNDLVATTNRVFGKPNFTQIATSLQDYTVMTDIILANKVEEQGGTGLQWDVMVNHNQSATNVGIGAVDNPVIRDSMVQAQADWRGTTANWGIFAEEIDMNMGDSRIVDLLNQREISCRISVAEKMETNFWGPPVALTDTVTPWGVKTWVVKNATEGFNGGVPSGYTTIGLNPTTYPRWKNYTAQYANVTEDDLIAKWRKAAKFTKFKKPVPNPDFNTGDKYMFATNYGVYGPLGQYLKANNENLGMDLAKYDNEMVFMGTPIRWVPALEADTTNPVYGLNMGVFKAIFLRNWWMRKTVVNPYPGQHTLRVEFYDFRYQFVMRDRRSTFVLATGTTEPS